MANSPNLVQIAEQLAADYLSRRNYAALAIALVQGDKTFLNTFGTSSTNSGTLDSRTLFEIGSITKVFTGICLAQLLIDSAAKLDDSIALYLPETVKFSPSVQTITLKHLATHSSGLPRLPQNLDLTAVDPENPYKNYGVQDLYQALETVELLAEPGTQYEYSNFGMTLLGYLLALRTNQSYESLVQQIICQPLSLTDTAIVLTPEQQQRLIAPHSPDGQIVFHWDFGELPAAGGLRSTPQDMLQFLQASLGQIESPVKRAIERSQQPEFESGNDRLGLAWHILHLPEKPLWHWHNGGTGGFVSFLGIDRSHQTGVVLMANSGDAMAEDSSLDVIALQLIDAASQIPLSHSE
ncbi:serine hydrolase domain-containing protein [Leptolyngbya ohadii]|uniref:serine hydrolase domain-containing protein n=1 Tax=Leptolyngbya ohadii TaxID=1962290 RepID=UPI0015C5C861|nr:serine hydrolase domain-containing protein [Leptolyngbya ohadii]